MFKVIGLTGGIASGKSQVAQTLREHGITVVDADRLAKDLLDTDLGIQKRVLEIFGTLDRKEIRQKIFLDSSLRRQLEGILHPEIRNFSEREFKNAESSGKLLAVYEAALLIETGWTPSHGHMDGLLVVISSTENRLQRLSERDRGKFVDPRVLESQCSDEDRKKEATWIIENNGSLEELRTKTIAWLKGLTENTPDCSH